MRRSWAQSIVLMVDVYSFLDKTKKGTGGNVFSRGIYVIPVLDQWTTATVVCADDNSNNLDRLEILKGHCWDYSSKNEWWTYRWCYNESVDQLHFHRRGSEPSARNRISLHDPNLVPESTVQYFIGEAADCVMDDGDFFKRRAKVTIGCCAGKKRNIKRRATKADVNIGTHIHNVDEYLSCHYHIDVCCEILCESAKETSTIDDVKAEIKAHPKSMKGPRFSSRESAEDDGHTEITPIPKTQTPTQARNLQEEDLFQSRVVTEKQQSELKEIVRAMFYHGYDSYMNHAYPQAELRPISCTGGQFDLIKIPYVTLIDTLDTLVVLGNHSEFKRVVKLITDSLSSFEFDVSVSLFETTIRVLGGLVSAHLMAEDPALGIYSGVRGDHYDGKLLALAIDLADRLLPAFRTVTHIPYGTVNLAQGVPKGETELASTAGAGSLVLEFEVLSYLTGDMRYGRAAMRAAEAIFERRSELGLVGKHIHVRSGKWHETLSGVGSNSDSFYEYLIKAYLLFRRKDYYDMFAEVFRAVKAHSMSGDWFVDVDMFSGKMRKKRSENLQAFWPGMEAMLGMTESSARLLNSFYIVWSDVGFLPEEFDYLKWAPGKSGAVSQLYPLRPELIESTYLHYRATGDRSWLLAGRDFLLSLQTHTRTECGYATVKDVMKRELEDSMPSFFLSETCKYLYLLFDENNFIHNRGYIFTTEAHPIDPLQLSRYDTHTQTTKAPKDTRSSFLEMFDRFLDKLTGTDLSPENDQYVPDVDEEGEGGHLDVDERVLNAQYVAWRHGRDLHSYHLKCPKPDWWNHSPYVPARDMSSLPAAVTGDNLIDVDSDNAVNSDVVGIQQIFDLLSRKHQRLANAEDSLDPEYSCSVDEDPGLVQEAAAQSSQPSGPIGERVVNLEVPSLGKFVVSIYPDGFIVKSLRFDNTIEIAGVGQQVVFVKEYNSTHSSTASASFSGTVSVCTVRLQVDWLAHGSGDPTGKSTWGAKDYMKEFLPAELEKERCCSMAAYGPTSNVARFPGQPLVAPLLRPVDVSSCHKPGRVTTHVEQVVDGVGYKEGATAMEATEPSRGWFSWVSGSAKKNQENLAKRPHFQSSPYQGSVVIADRGSCMFEQKTIFAEEGGAVGLIVVNTEPNLFMMSGIKQVASEAELVDDDSPQVAENAGKTTIPSVMVTDRDGKFLIGAAQYLQSKGVDASVVINMLSTPAILDNPSMGYSGHPNIRMGDKLMHIVGLGGWGAALSKTDNNEWQLYIVPNSDLLTINPWGIGTNRGQFVTSNSAFSFNPVNAYHQLFSEQCPSIISSVNNVVELIKFD